MTAYFWVNPLSDFTTFTNYMSSLIKFSEANMAPIVLYIMTFEFKIL